MLRRQRSMVAPLLYIGMHTEISGFAGFTDTTLDASPGTTWRLRD
ncbi:Uncharacterised protein [Mycobacterium tuberculosis]|nr:Uncharacterised protein [Mycobacterium tuberculosis]